MPKIPPAMMDLREQCIVIVERLANTCEVSSYREGFERVYYGARSRRTKCGFDHPEFQRAYDQFRKFRSLTKAVLYDID